MRRIAAALAALLAGCSGSAQPTAFDAAPDRVIGGDASEADAAPDAPADAETDAPMPVDAGRDSGPVEAEVEAGPPGEMDAGRDAGVSDGGAPTFECDVYAQDCPEHYACRFRVGERGTVCVNPVGRLSRGSSCTSTGQCAPGLQCLSTWGGGDPHCARLCNSDEQCADLSPWTCIMDDDITGPDLETGEMLPVYPDGTCG